MPDDVQIIAWSSFNGLSDAICHMDSAISHVICQIINPCFLNIFDATW